MLRATGFPLGFLVKPTAVRFKIVDMVHGIDFTWFQTFLPRLRHEAEINAMQHKNSVFHALTKHIPWAVFERLVAEHKADHRVRRLDGKSQLLALGQARRDRYLVFAIGTGINAHDLTAGANCACKLQSQQSWTASNGRNLVP